MLFLFASFAQAQLISERTQGKVIIGADIFTDLSTGPKYENFDLRAINQGVSVYSMFNFQFDNSPHSASVGVGYTGHNYYMKGAYLRKPYHEVTEFVDVPHDYKISKINVNYVDIPIEVSFRIADKFKITPGFKFGLLVGGKSKFVGELFEDEQIYRLKANRINNLEKYVYLSSEMTDDTSPKKGLNYSAYNLEQCNDILFIGTSNGLMYVDRSLLDSIRNVLFLSLHKALRIYFRLS